MLDFLKNGEKRLEDLEERYQKLEERSRERIGDLEERIETLEHRLSVVSKGIEKKKETDHVSKTKEWLHGYPEKTIKEPKK